MDNVPRASCSGELSQTLARDSVSSGPPLIPLSRSNPDSTVQSTLYKQYPTELEKIHITIDYLDRFITGEVYDKLVEATELAPYHYDKAARFCGTVLERPGQYICFPFSLKFKKRKNGDLTERSFIGKLMPKMKMDNSREVIRDLYLLDGYVTSKLLTKMKPFLSDDDYSYPTLLFMKEDVGSELMIFNDVLHDEGYVMHNYILHTPNNVAEVVMKTIARFHAASILTKIANGSLQSLLPLIGEERPLSYTDEFTIVEDNISGIFEANSRLLIRTQGEHSVIAKQLHFFRPQAYRITLDQLKPSEKFEVLSLGSVSENPLYSNADKSKLCLMSFGGSCITTPAADLNNFFYTCLDIRARVLQKDDLLNVYYAAFKSFLKEKGNEQPPFTIDELRAEVKEKTFLGVYAAMQNLPAYIGGPDYNANLMFYNYSDVDDYNTDYLDNLESLYKANLFFRARLQDLFSNDYDEYLHRLIIDYKIIPKDYDYSLDRY